MCISEVFYKEVGSIKCAWCIAHSELDAMWKKAVHTSVLLYWRNYNFSPGDTLPADFEIFSPPNTPD